MELIYDIFFSYRHINQQPVLEIVAALEVFGLKIWYDGHIDDFAPINQEVIQAIANSKTMLTYYSRDYPLSLACQWELRTAFMSCLNRGFEPTARILVINPELAPDHIQPQRIRNALYISASGLSAQDIAARVRDKLTSPLLSEPLGVLDTASDSRVLPTSSVRWYPFERKSSQRFVGRFAEMWAMNSALHAAEEPMMTAQQSAALVQLVGMGGMGKSLLAEEYALRFAAAYPGGIFWLNAATNDEGQVDEQHRSKARSDQWRGLALSLGLSVADADAENIEQLVSSTLQQIGKPYLWIVDDLPAGLSDLNATGWLAPTPLGKTLITTRSREYSGTGIQVAVGALSPQEGYQLLTKRKQPQGAAEEGEAHGLVEGLGRHTMALDVAGAAIRLQTFADFRKSLAQPDKDGMRLAAMLAGSLPNGHEASIAATLLKSITLLNEAGRDILRVATNAASAPIPIALIANAFQAVYNGSEASDMALVGAAQCEQLSLSDVGEKETLLVHALVRRTMEFYDENNQRKGQLKSGLVAALFAALVNTLDITTHRDLAVLVPHARKLATEGQDVTTAGLIGLLGNHDQAEGDYASAAQLYEREMNLRTTLQGEENPDAIRAADQLGQMLSRLGNVAKAEQLQSGALERSERLFGANNELTIAIALNLSVTLQRKGDFATTKLIQEQILTYLLSVVGEDHMMVLQCKNNLATSLEGLNQLEDALVLREAVLQKSRQLLGENHPFTLHAANNFAALRGRVQPGLKSSIVAVSALLATSEKAKDVLGESHPDRLLYLDNLAQQQLQMGSTGAAIDYYQEKLELCIEKYGDDHPETRKTMAQIANVWIMRGDFAQALPLLQQLLERSVKTQGNRDPDVTLYAWNLFATLHRLGRRPEAQKIHDEYITWLLQVDPATLKGAQVDIYQHIYTMIRQAQQGGTQDSD